MNQIKYFLIFLFLFPCLLRSEGVLSVYPHHPGLSDSTYIYHSVNVITGEYSESQNDLHLSGLESFVLRRFHNRNDRFIYGWHCNLPNLLHAPMSTDAGQFTPSQKITYGFDSQNRLKSVTASDYTDREIYGWMNIQYTDGENRKCHITTHDHQQVTYHFQNKYLISEVQSTAYPTISYKYHPHPSGEGYVIHRRELPQGRYLENEYYPQGHEHAGKVCCQKQPLGTDQAPIIIQRFMYYPGYTVVLDAIGCQTLYRYANGHITSIENYDQEGILCRKEVLIWTIVGSEKNYQIQTRYIADAQDNILMARSFAYDAQGHMIKETLYGNLTGISLAPIVIGQNGYPLKNGVESYSISHEYSQNLLSKTREDNGKTTLFYYDPQTQLLMAKLIAIKDQIISREFYSYNSNRQISKIIHDDGSSVHGEDMQGVTERHIKNISYRSSPPALGLAEIIEECYFDFNSNQEKLNKKSVYHYNEQAVVTRQDTYDSTNAYQYSVYHEYDACKRLIASTDEKGALVEKCYDDNNNLIKTTSIDAQGLFQEIRNTYDYSNRLICTENFDNEGQAEKIYFYYDHKGQKIGSLDACGNKTDYVYDALGREIKRILPAVLDENLTIVRPTLHKVYDALDRVIAETDAKGLTKYIEYNVRGKPIKITHPDQRVERFLYNYDGSLKNVFDTQGGYIVYKRDPLGRVEKVYSFVGIDELIEETNLKHNIFHLLEATEQSGQKICYKYDAAGRLCTLEQYIRDHLCKRLSYEYNSLGQQIITKEWLGPNLEDYIQTVKSYTPHHLLISTHIENSQGEVQKFIAHDEKPSTSKEKKEHIVNLLGQTCLQITEMDSLGNCIVTEYDALQRPCSIITKNSLGQQIGRRLIRWDVNHHKVREDQFINAETSITTLWEYNSLDRLEAVMEGVGTENPRRTQYSYHENGQLASITKPDGVKLFYQYYPTGDISKLYSSDQSINYHFEYDTKHRLTCIQDEKNQTLTQRTYSQDGCLLEDEQGNGLKTSRLYDALNRCIKLELPDQTCVEYKYQGSYLKEIHRQNAQRSYTHQYAQRDLNGHVLINHLAGSIGQEIRQYDEKGHLNHITTPFWSENIYYHHDQSQTIQRIVTQGENGLNTYHFSYDSNNRLLEENSIAPQAFTYDWLGHLTSKNQKNCLTNPLGQLTQDGNCRYAYDLNGNLIEKIHDEYGKLSFKYDALNRMVSLRNDNGEEYRYTYDALHRRLSKTCFNRAGQLLWEQKFLYNDLQEIGSANMQNTILEFRVLGEGLGAEIGSAVALEIDRQTYVPIHDHRGSVCCLIDLDTKNIAEEIYYTAFGEEKNGYGSSSNPWRFSSKRLDAESGFLYFGKRYYDPSSCLWTTQDPLGLMESPNPYAFASNNPLSRIDPYGLFSFSTLWQSFYHQLSSIGHQVASVFQSVNGFINQHLSLEHNFKSKVDNEAVALFGKTWLNLYGFYLDKQEVGVYGQGEINDKVRITLINGILNARHDVIDVVELISKLHGNNNIHYIFRPTEGWTYDLIKSTFVRFGWVSPQAKQLAAHWKNLIAEMGGVGGGGKIIHYAHSIGASDTLLAKSLLSHEELKMIQVFTFGSPSLLSPEGFQSVTNYVSRGDGVSLLLDPIQCIKALLDPVDHILFLPGAYGYLLIDHYLTSETYQTILESLGKQFLDLYGPS